MKAVSKHNMKKIHTYVVIHQNSMKVNRLHTLCRQLLHNEIQTILVYRLMGYDLG